MTNDKIVFSFNIEKEGFYGADNFQNILELWDDSFLLKPALLFLTGSKSGRPIKKYTDILTNKGFNSKKGVILIDSFDYNCQGTIVQASIFTRYSVTISSLVYSNLEPQGMLDFFIKNIELCVPAYAMVHLDHNIDYLQKTYYHKRRISYLFRGFHWLEYFDNNFIEKNGGNDGLENNPYVTRKQRLPHGLLLQVGDTPFDCLTPEGEAMLVKATNAIPERYSE